MGLPRQPNTTPDGIHMPGSGAMLYTVAEAGALLRISTRSVWRRIAEGKLAVVKLSDRSTRILGDSLRSFIRLGRDVQVKKDIAATTPATVGALNKLACDYAEAHGPGPVLKLLEQFGVRALGDIPVERRAEFRDKLLKL